MKTAGIFAGLALLASCTSPSRTDFDKLSPTQFAARPEMKVMLDSDHLDLARLAAAIFHETNRVRRELGLPRFRQLVALDTAADLQANSNALAQSASHYNLAPILATPFDRVLHVGLNPQQVGENAAFFPLLDIDPSHGIQESQKENKRVSLDAETGRELQPHTYASFAAALVKAWMNSPEHRANLVNPKYRYVGCSGRPAKTLHRIEMVACVQVFYTPRTEP